MPKVRILITRLVQNLYEVEVDADEIDGIVDGFIPVTEIVERPEAITLQVNEHLENSEVFTEDDPEYSAYLIH